MGVKIRAPNLDTRQMECLGTRTSAMLGYREVIARPTMHVWQLRMTENPRYNRSVHVAQISPLLLPHHLLAMVFGATRPLRIEWRCHLDVVKVVFHVRNVRQQISIINLFEQRMFMGRRKGYLQQSIY